MGETVSLASTLSGIERLVVGFCRFFALSLLSWIVSLSPSRRLSISPSLCFPFMLHDAGCIPRSSSPRMDSPTTEAVRSDHYQENELLINFETQSIANHNITTPAALSSQHHSTLPRHSLLGLVLPMQQDLLPRPPLFQTLHQFPHRLLNLSITALQYNYFRFWFFQFPTRDHRG